MKNLKTKLLILGVLTTVALSSTPVFAATNTSTSNTSKIITMSNKNSVSKVHNNIIKPEFNYGPYGGPDADTIINNGGIIQYGDEGQAVVDVQGILAHMGFLSQSDIDGIFGSKTKNAVINFQKNFNNIHGYTLQVDGIVGRNTWIAMMP